MNKKYFLRLFHTLIAVCFVLNGVIAQSFVNESVAKQIGATFISNKAQKSNPQLNLFHIEKGDDGQPNLYIYNVEGGGFVIVSASKNMRPVLAYSLTHSYEGEIPETAWYFIENYSKNVDYCDANDVMMNGAETEWKLLENNQLPVARNEKTVNPLIQTLWNQDYPYNYYAPETGGGWWGGPGGHCYAGCVACAMSQIMKYWNHPVQGHGSHSYTHSTYGIQSANFGETTYNWSIMPNELGYQANDAAKAVALLMYHCGVSVNMNFGPDGSGAYSKDVEAAMRKYFGYCAAEYKERKDYTEDEWIAMLKSELDKSQPVYFSGTNDSGGGHAIVCDGYDNNDYFHFNLGWSGSGNDYYNINDVAGFHINEAIVMNIVPLEINSDANGIIYVASDGTGDGSSWENATRYLEYASALSTDSGTQVWVKTGTYNGDVNSSKGSFLLYKLNKVYGGFTGNETPDFNIEDRDLEANPTILDGQNERCVLFQVDNITNYETAVWDGFTIQNGHAGMGAGATIGGNCRLINCKFLNNNATGSGGAIYIVASYYNNSSVKLVNCVFEGNSASLGGAIGDMLGVTIQNCRFTNNTASTKGGAYYIFMNQNGTIVNSIFDENNAKLGGAVYNKGNITMTNCDLVNNHALENGGAMYNESHDSYIYNSILWGNDKNGTPNQIYGPAKYNYCAIQGGYGGTNNINLSGQNDGSETGNYPRFENPEEGNYAIDRTSVCVDAGDNSVSGIIEPDFLGNPRIVNGIIDMGAIENQYYDMTDDVVAETFDVYPNPFDNQLIISMDGNFVVEVYNSLGQKIASAEAQNEMIMNTTEWDRGVYFVKVNGTTVKVLK